MYSRVRNFLKNSLIVITLIVLATVDTILSILKINITIIIIVDLIIALAISLAYFDERIIKLEKSIQSINKRLNKKGVTQFIAIVIWILVILLLIAVFTGQPNFVSENLGLNLTKP